MSRKKDCKFLLVDFNFWEKKPLQKLGMDKLKRCFENIEVLVSLQWKLAGGEKHLAA